MSINRPEFQTILPREGDEPFRFGYFVDDRGNVYRVADGLTSRLKAHPDKDGYPRVRLLHCGKVAGTTHRVHQLVCAAFHGPRPSPVHLVRHKDGVKTNNVPSNLAWGTTTENAADKRRLKEMPSGARHHTVTKPGCMAWGEGFSSSKLKDAQVLAIVADPRTNKALGIEYGVSTALISHIRTGRAWSRLTGIKKPL